MARKIEVDEAEAARYVRLAQTVSKVAQHPEGKLLLQRAHKLVDPNARTPDLDQVHQAQQPLVELRDAFTNFVQSQATKDAQRDQDAKINTIKQHYDEGIAKLRREGWTEEGIKAVETLAQEKGLLDPLDAAAIYEKAHPPQTVAAPRSTGAWNFAEGIDAEDPMKKLLDSKGKNDLVVDKMANDALNEFRQQLQPARR